MIRTCLQVVQDFCYRANLPAPASLYGSTDPNTLQLMHCLYEVCRRCRAAKCFPQQKRSYSFDTVASTARYSLPADFYSPTLETLWNQDEDIHLIGPKPDNEFTELLYGGVASSTNYSYRIFGSGITGGSGQFWLSPTPSGVDTLSFEYITASFFIPTAGWADNVTTLYEVIAADTDNVLFDHDVVSLGLEAEYKRQNGGDYMSALELFESRLEEAVTRLYGVRRGSFSQAVTGPHYRVPVRGWSL